MKYYYTEIIWDVRYPPNWTEIRKQAHKLTRGICCCCLKNLSIEAHHSRYLYVNDKPGFNIFPLCISCHKLSHSPKNWTKHKGNPLWKSCNTLEWENKLRQGIILLEKSRSHEIYV